jgi:hypothetical protein
VLETEPVDPIFDTQMEERAVALAVKKLPTILGQEGGEGEQVFLPD